ncbi:MAG: hypothetical protein SH850_09265 [Planctomycetaceae bacterium]|nr:hypothetical protein [Planctomycetaceae bacterium]
MNVFDEIGLNPDDLDRNVFGRMAKTLIQNRLSDADSEFEAASVAAEDWLNILAMVGHYCEERNRPSHNVDKVYRLLMPTAGDEPQFNLLDSYGKHAAVIEQMKGRLAVVSDGDFPSQALTPSEFPIPWCSAHEHVAGTVRLALENLVCPLEGITDPADQVRAAGQILAAHWKRFAKSPIEVSSLQSHIRRERAKVLHSPDADKNLDPYLPAESPKQCANRMRCHLDTVKRYIDAGKLKRIIVTARRWRLHREDVRKLGGKID